MADADNSNLVPSQRRLQREPDFTGSKLASFREVALRHGLPGALLGLLFLVLPQSISMLQTGFSQAINDPPRIAVVLLVVFIALNLYAWFIDRNADRAWGIEKAGWVLYLGAVSAWEEWVFRLALPNYLEGNGVSMLMAIVISNLIFGVAHYFTLRWKWQWCLAAFIGGMALSRQFTLHENLMLVILIHWVATFLNTPRLPGASNDTRRESAI